MELGGINQVMQTRTRIERTTTGFHIKTNGTLLQHQINKTLKLRSSIKLFEITAMKIGQGNFVQSLNCVVAYYVIHIKTEIQNSNNLPSEVL